MFLPQHFLHAASFSFHHLHLSSRKENILLNHLDSKQLPMLLVSKSIMVFIMFKWNYFLRKKRGISQWTSGTSEWQHLHFRLITHRKREVYFSGVERTCCQYHCCQGCTKPSVMVRLLAVFPCLARASQLRDSQGTIRDTTLSV